MLEQGQGALETRSKGHPGYATWQMTQMLERERDRDTMCVTRLNYSLSLFFSVRAWLNGCGLLGVVSCRRQQYMWASAMVIIQHFIFTQFCHIYTEHRSTIVALTVRDCCSCTTEQCHTQMCITVRYTHLLYYYICPHPQYIL